MDSHEINIEVRYNAVIRRLVVWMAGVFALVCLIAIAVKSFSWG